eukprot:m.44993 g.44993  ORF g.44993 m.44993 type:complete len:1329 (-) comp12394_c0_seq1:234-4220(-)
MATTPTMELETLEATLSHKKKKMLHRKSYIFRAQRRGHLIYVEVYYLNDTEKLKVSFSVETNRSPPAVESHGARGFVLHPQFDGEPWTLEAKTRDIRNQWVAFFKATETAAAPVVSNLATATAAGATTGATTAVPTAATATATATETGTPEDPNADPNQGVEFSSPQPPRSPDEGLFKNESTPATAGPDSSQINATNRTSDESGYLTSASTLSPNTSIIDSGTDTVSDIVRGNIRGKRLSDYFGDDQPNPAPSTTSTATASITSTSAATVTASAAASTLKPVPESPSPPLSKKSATTPSQACIGVNSERAVIFTRPVHVTDSYKIVGLVGIEDTERKDMLETAARSVCRLETREGRCLGTGWLFKSKHGFYYIITNRHVADQFQRDGFEEKYPALANFAPIPLSNCKKYRYTLDLKHIEHSNNSYVDIAIFALGSPEEASSPLLPDAQPLKLASDLGIGQVTAVIGYPGPRLYPTDRAEGVKGDHTLLISHGVVTRRSDHTIFEYEAVTGDRSSGSPIVNSRGRVIGMHMMRDGDDGGIKRAVSLHLLTEILGQLPSDNMFSTRVPHFLMVPQPEKWKAGDVHSHAALLNPRNQYVPFHCYLNNLVEKEEQLFQKVGLPFLTIRLIHGKCGVGKTRLALELIRRAKEAGWGTLWQTTAIPENSPQQIASWIKAQPATATILLVVDYSESCQAALLQTLNAVLQNREGREAGARLHILCLAREASWWGQFDYLGTSSVLDVLSNNACNLGAFELPLLPIEHRLAAFDEVTDSLSKLLELPKVQPGALDLSHDDYGRLIVLHLRALAALQGKEIGDLTDIITTQIKLEFSHWQRRHGPDILSLDQWREIQTWLALVGRASQDDLAEALIDLKIAKPPTADSLGKKLLSVCSEEDPAYATPPMPHVFNQQLVLHQLGTNRGKVVMNAALKKPETAQGVLTMLASLNDFDPFETERRPLPQTAKLWQRNAVGCLLMAWLRPGYPRVFLRAGEQLGRPAMRWLLPSWAALLREEQERVAVLLPFRERPAKLLELTTNIAIVTYDAASSTAGKAKAAVNLASCLRRFHDKAYTAEARELLKHAVSLYRGMKKLELQTYQSDLARALNDLARAELKLQSNDPSACIRATTLATESVSIRRAQVEQDGSLVHRRLSLGTSLITLAKCLALCPGPTDALDQSRDAKLLLGKIHRKKNMPDCRSLYASALALHSELLLRNDPTGPRKEEALSQASHSLELRRELAEEDPDMHKPGLASALKKHAAMLRTLPDPGLQSEADKHAAESRQIFSELAAELPTIFDPAYIATLNSRSTASRNSCGGGQSVETPGDTQPSGLL